MVFFLNGRDTIFLCLTAGLKKVKQITAEKPLTNLGFAYIMKCGCLRRKRLAGRYRKHTDDSIGRPVRHML